MAKSRALLAALGGLAMGAAGVQAMTIPRSSSHTKILRQVEDVQDEYDYVIVGGGTAGLTVADRLTESGEYTVLVIERGLFGNDSSVNNVSGGSQAYQNSSLSFNFPSVPQVNLGNRVTGVVGGVMLGGSSGVNGMQVHRPQKADIDRWGSYFGPCSEWNWDNLLPYFRKSWRLHPPTPEMVEQFNIKYDTSYWGGEDDGGIHASFPTFHWPFMRAQMDAFADIEGIEFPVDSGAGDPGAFWYPASFEPTQVRRSFAMSEYWAGKGNARDNYETILGHRVVRVLFEDEEAVGVEYVDSNSRDTSQARTVRARKEVIIAAGTIYTPQVLQASGIGPRPVLERAGIDVLVDLPGVGANFQDHPLGAQALFYFTNWNFSPNPSDLQSNATFRALAEAEFAANRTGPLMIASGNAAAFLPFPVVAPERFEAIAAAYEAQDPAAYLHEGADETVVAGYQAQKSRLADALRSMDAANYNLFIRGSQMEGSVVYLHPLSRGTIEINATDPYFGTPVVDYRALSNPADIDIQVEFIRFTRRYFTETRLAQYGPIEFSPGAQVTSDEALRQAVRSQVSPTTFHPVGTAAMMPRELGGVVDENLLVYGVEKLSVIDASIQPELPGAYTQQPVYAVAEKAADLIKERA
ncbi:alcohol oxidase [Sodiomyces alkalinus F11]|uniref:Alcohol oxidase n=1 Tax=Sodiomyces alkalinus (strain CBS 110278 / VKM F-3762 / F11) TaxID=1314773 RepID=A0A3N2PP61_SODAK|nr:alcohol oxidase [Sodiomyces alkalinus F11]ROT36220.1 alcohol oxidase [Sodiomyces alkalinus F11]